MKIKRIVIIEDDELLLSLLELLLGSYLEESGVVSNIYLFSSCDAFLSEFGNFLPDLILSDVNTKSRINGLELLKKLRKKIPKTLYVIMSANDYEEKALEFGADRFLEKPFDNNEIRAILQKIA
jgi:DNA-binding response OmpR family regulator